MDSPFRRATLTRRTRRLRQWLENTQNFLRLSAVLVIPLVIGGVTWLANSVELLPFLLFPPLASGAYTLFTTPGSPHANPRRFVGGMTIGAAAGWLALTLTTRYWYVADSSGLVVNPGAAALGVFLTGLVTWMLDVQVPQAFSTALLVLVLGGGEFVFVVSVFVSAVAVVAVATVWRREVYDRRAEFLYRTIDRDDDVLVPIRDGTDDAITAFAAQLAGAHDAGRVVLLDVVDADDPAAAASDDASGPITADDGTVRLTQSSQEADGTIERRVAGVERLASEVEERFGVPTDSVIVRGGGNDAETVVESARRTGCDLIVTPYETEDAGLSTFVRALFDHEVDVIAARLAEPRDWNRVLVPVRRAGDVAHAMLDFGGRLVGSDGTVTTVNAINDESQRRDAEGMLADLAETFERTVETSVVRESIETYLSNVATRYDLVIVGSSTDRSKASRFIAPPTFQRLDSLACDVAIVHRG